MRKSSKLVSVLLTATFIAHAAASAAEVKKPAAATPAKSLSQSLSVLDLMRASNEVPADGIWAIQGADTISEEEWQVADQDAVNLIAGIALATRGGAGKNDARWVAAVEWQNWMRDMQKTAFEIRAAVKATDQKKMAAAADHLQQLCEGCHTKYRPQAPSDGVVRYPYYPKRELVK
jgi:cytochrome c'